MAYAEGMNDQVSHTRKVAGRALAMIIGAAAVAWVLYLVTIYVSELGSRGGTNTDESHFQFEALIAVAAVAALGIGVLLAKRTLDAARAPGAARSPLVDAVATLSNTVLIISASLAVWGALIVFLGGIENSDNTDAVVRIVNLYLPIVLYTALVVTLILAGFVFVPATARSKNKGSAKAAADAEPVVLSQVQRRTTALAYAVPIIAAAIALLVGLIVFDVTREAPEAWIWVAILALVAVGVFFGTRLAAAARPSTPLAPAVITGARNLNFVLTIVFAVAAAGMSLGYGASAISTLYSTPTLTLEVYDAKNGEPADPDKPFSDVADPTVTGWISGAKVGSDAVVTLQPGDTEVASVKVDRSGSANIDHRWPKDVAAGSYTLVLSAVDERDKPLEVKLDVVIGEDGSLTLPKAASADYDEPALKHAPPISVNWLLRELIPAGLMLASGLALISTTVRMRNRD